MGQQDVETSTETLKAMAVSDIEESYGLSSLQAGMLFNHLYLHSPGVDFMQAVITLREVVRPDLLEKAWQEVIDQHAVLRTSFEWENVPDPVQHVHRSACIRIECEDLRNLTRSAQEEALQQYQLQNSRRGFDFTRPPLIRLKLFQLADSLYTLIWSYHHIIIDGRSLALILQEVFQRYDAYVAGREVRLEPARQYREFVGRAKQPDLPSAEQFWQEKLKGFTAATSLPKDKQKGSGADDLYPYREIHLSEEVTARLNALAAAQNITLNTIVQAVWALLLSRYSGDTDVVFGASKTVRHAVPDGKSIVGLMLSTLPVRVRVDEKASISSWLESVREEWLSYRGFEHTPLTLIQRASELLPGARPFETLLMFEHDHYANYFDQLSGGKNRSLSLCYSNPGYPLTLLAFGGHRIQLVICYDSGEFIEAAIDRMLGHLGTLLQGIAANPHQPVGKLEILTASERQLISGWNETLCAYPAMCVHEVFEQQAERAPNAVAIIAESEHITYAELNRRANQLARHLQSKGVKPGALVGICLHRSVNMVLAVLATLKTGAAYVPLDPEYPRERINFMLQDAGVRILLSERALADDLRLDHAKTMYLDELWPSIETLPGDNTDSRATPDDLVYVIYTSGSTGKPKGVCLPHRALSNLLYWQLENSKAGLGTRTLQFTSLSFDVSFQEIFATWCSGGTLVLISESLRRDSIELLRLMREENVQRLFLPFVALQSLGEVAEDESQLPDLREVITAGEQLQITPQIQRFFERLPNCTLHNHYGPSESHVVTAFTLQGHPRTWPALPPIGRPIANTQIYLLDAQLRPVPVGVNGELYVGGTALATGYLHRPELTRERFVSTALSAESEARLYRTGDLARYLPNGDIECLGRIDNQVKVRGHRIELGEIEAVLRQHPGVRDAAVAVTGTQAGKRLAGYVVPVDTAAEDTGLFSEIRAYLKQTLPEYMVPTAFARIEALPLTPSGKINRRALPEIGETQAQPTGYVAPRTPDEAALAAIWTEVLKVEHIGVRDNFFEFGHSLQATQVMSRIRRKLNADVPLRVLFENPTIESLAQAVEASRKQHSVGSMAIVPVSRDQQLPLSFAQQRMWFIHQMEPDNPVYNLPIAVWLSGPLDVAILQQSLNEIVRRHEILRTTFKVVNDTPVQVIAPELLVEIAVCDLVHITAEQRETEAQRMLWEEALPPFDLACGPLLRSKLLRFSGEEHVFIITLHHIVGDGWSASVLFEELSVLYDSLLASKPLPLPPLTIQYADFATAQRKWLQGDVLGEQFAFWRKQLQGAPTLLELPTDRPRPQRQSFRGALHSVTICGELLHKLKALGQQQGATLFMTLMAAFQVLLGRCANLEDFVVGTDLANRTSIETERLIGFFINVLPIRAKLSGNPKFSELLGRVRETSVNAFAHQDMPLDKLIEELQPERALSHNPLIQVLFVLQNAPRRSNRIGGAVIEPFDFDIKFSKFDLAVFFEERGDELSASWLYVTDLLDSATITRMAAHYETLLQSIVADPEVRIASLEMLTAAEREQQALEQQQRQSSRGKQLKMARRKAVEFSSEVGSGAMGQ